MANERRLISVCGECSNYDWKKHKCMVCSCKESDPRSPFYDDCPLPKAVEVVHCRDCVMHRALDRMDLEERSYAKGCVWCGLFGTGMWEEDFCSYGERRCE